jgi:predicted AAA+ superfamily ATPase
MIKESLNLGIREYHESSLPDLIERHEMFDLSILDSQLNNVITIVGPCRAGKTFFSRLPGILKPISS